MNWVDIAFYVGCYLVASFVIMIILGIIAESEHGKARKWWATMAALWLIWPIALPAGIIYALGVGMFKSTRYFWKLRDEDE